jgi:hypothetical protein
MITSNDLFYTAKGPGEWPSSPKYIGQLSSAPKARKEVHTHDDCGRTHSLPHCVLSRKIGRNKDGSRNGSCMPPFLQGAERVSLSHRPLTPSMSSKWELAYYFRPPSTRGLVATRWGRSLTKMLSHPRISFHQSWEKWLRFYFRPKLSTWQLPRTGSSQKVYTLHQGR